LRQLGLAGLVAALPRVASANAAPVPETPTPFGFDQVRARAEALAGRAYTSPRVNLPQPLAGQDVNIRFRGAHGLWRDDAHPFRVALAHLGGPQRWPVQLNVIEDGIVLRLPYRPDMFDFGEIQLARDLDPGFGFAGIMLHHSDADPRDFPEVAAFEGSSRFRLIGHDQEYGASARALAINIATPDGEELPRFREFWLERPQAGAEAVMLYALLDSPSLTGAYRFVVRPGLVTVAEITATLFTRAAVRKLGIAPLSAMFLYDQIETDRFDDIRPEVHDADGLLMHNGQGLWIWRTLINHGSLQVSAFVDDGSKGFGLFQRDRAFAHYQDLSVRFDRKPSLWVEPIGSWGPGWVELVEIPSDRDQYENVVAYWVDDKPVSAGAQVELAYRLHAQGPEPRRPPLGRVEDVWVGAGSEPGARRFVVDFAGGPLTALGVPPEPVFTVRRGRLGEVGIKANQPINGWRASLELHPEGEESCEISGYLQQGAERVTETWVYRWTGQ
jgi:glucans biosynthesis protein